MFSFMSMPFQILVRQYFNIRFSSRFFDYKRNPLKLSRIAFQKNLVLTKFFSNNKVLKTELISTSDLDDSCNYSQVINNQKYMTKVTLTGKVREKPIYFDYQKGKVCCFYLITRSHSSDDDSDLYVTSHHLTCFLSQYFDFIEKAAELNCYVNVSGSLQYKMSSLKNNETVNVISLKFFNPNRED